MPRKVPRHVAQLQYLRYDIKFYYFTAVRMTETMVKCESA